MNKIIFLDRQFEEVHISDYDTGKYEDFFQFLEAYNKKHSLNLNWNHCEWMEVDRVIINKN